MTRILLRSGKDPRTPVGAEATLAQNVINGNVGNFLFGHSVHQALSVPGVEVVSNSTLSETRPASPEDIARANEEFDVFVVPLANAFRPDFARQLGILTSFVSGLTIPVVVIGVGAQTDLSLEHGQMAAVDEAAREFVAAVLDRSASIGVRGGFTSDYLQRLGFPAGSIDIIGCPSLYSNGPDFRLSKRPGDTLPDDSRIALNLTPGVPGLGEMVETLVARHPELVWVGQDGKDLRLILWGEDRTDGHDPRLPVHRGHRLFQEGRVRFPLDMRTWTDYLRGFDFVVGTRFHGNVVGTLADTPAMLLVHDSRTLELAEYHALPNLRMDDLAAGTTAEQLYAAYDPDGFNAAYPGRFATYLAFLERNGLAHVHAPGQENPGFAAELRDAPLPPMVRPLTASTDDPVADRLRWIWDGQRLDLRAHQLAYEPPYPYPPPRDGTSVSRDRLKELRGRVGRLERDLAKARRESARLRKRAEQQTERLGRQQARLDRQAERLDRIEAQLQRRFTARLRALLRRG